MQNGRPLRRYRRWCTIVRFFTRQRKETLMARFHLTSHMLIDRPLTDTWTFLIDLPRVATWERGVRVVRQTSPGPAGVGTTLVVCRMFCGRETLVECCTTQWDEPHGVTTELH